MRSRRPGRGIGGVERGPAQLDLLLRGEQVGERDLDPGGESHCGRSGGRAGGASSAFAAARRRGAATRPSTFWIRVDLELVVHAAVAQLWRRR